MSLGWLVGVYTRLFGLHHNCVSLTHVSVQIDRAVGKIPKHNQLDQIKTGQWEKYPNITNQIRSQYDIQQSENLDRWYVVFSSIINANILANLSVALLGPLQNHRRESRVSTNVTSPKSVRRSCRIRGLPIHKKRKLVSQHCPLPNLRHKCRPKGVHAMPKRSY